MARKRAGYYLERGRACQITNLPSYDGQYLDQWCTRHAKYMCTCRWCGIEFHSDRPHTIFCSTAHSQKAYRARKAGLGQVNYGD